MQYETNRPPTRARAGLNSSLPKPTNAHFLYAGIGALIGLVVGLLFAWMVWPVQWSNAWPSDLSQEARAQYLAAVAEAYVYYGDAQAAEVARNRLFELNEDLGGYIAEAQRFFVDNPQASSRVYISNLGQLAQALNIQSPDIIIDTPIDGAGTLAPPAVEEATGVGDGVRAWVNWALTVLAALILVIGGFYVVARLNQRRQATSEADTLDDGGFDDEPGSGGYVRPVPAESQYMRPLRGTSAGLSVPTSMPPRGAPQRQSEDYGFDEGFDDDDLDDEYYEQGTTSRRLDYRSEDEVFDEPLDRDVFDADILEEELSEEDEMRAAFAPRRSVQLTGELDALDDDLEDEMLDEELLEGEPLAAEPVVAPTPPSRGSGAVRTLSTYTFQYHAGIADYDQSRPIVDPETKLQVGDCGMGVNSKNNVVQNNPDNVVALDVWLVDKKQEKSFNSQDRVLLSEYVIDHNLESTFTRERPNDPSPIIPQPGTTFQIKGPSLTLDCVVTDVSYIKNGPTAGMFQSLSIDMTVRSRG